MRGLTCDICGHIQLSDPADANWTDIRLGIKIIGSPDYQDICPQCTMWLIDVFDAEKKKRGVQ
jgi:hypothetical protein